MDKFTEFVSSIGKSDLRPENPVKSDCDMNNDIVADNVFLEQIETEERKAKTAGMENHALDLEAIGKINF